LQGSVLKIIQENKKSKTYITNVDIMLQKRI